MDALNAILALAPQFLLRLCQIVLLDLVLEGDNIGVIALAVKGLPPQLARKANLLGVLAAIGLRIVLVLLCGALLSLPALHVNLIGGALLLYITWNMVKNDGETKAVGSSASFRKCIGIIVLADLSMSVDNILCIASVALGGRSAIGPEEAALIILGLLVCVPILFFGSRLVCTLMERFPVIIYLCAGLLVHTSVGMILGDPLLATRLEPLGAHAAGLIAVVCGVLAFAAGALSLLYRQRRARDAK